MDIMAKNTLARDDQEAKWIHRDKLTQIEIQEYIDRGMVPPAELLNRVRQHREYLRSRQTRSPDNTPLDVKRQRVKSPDLSPDPSNNDDDAFVPTDPRTMAEIARDPYELGASHTMPRLRASSSKIPLATASPLPIPIEHIERDTPLRRKRDVSNDWDNDHVLQHRARSRSDSIGSQVLLDDEAFNKSISPQRSPSTNQGFAKIRVPTAANQILYSKQRTASGTSRAVSETAKSATQNGTNERPRTAVNRPEGDPPWLDQIYQPDPMLPPDQQMLPTHAKRMRAEQLEREAKLGAVYDRELSPIQAHASHDASPAMEKDEPHNELHLSPEPPDSPSWPLRTPTALELPRSPNPEHAGYSTMPKVQTTPSIGPMPSPRLPSKPEEQLQLEPVKDDTKKRSCGCCVVM